MIDAGIYAMRGAKKGTERDRVEAIFKAMIAAQ